MNVNRWEVGGKTTTAYCCTPLGRSSRSTRTGQKKKKNMIGRSVFCVLTFFNHHVNTQKKLTRVVVGVSIDIFFCNKYQERRQHQHQSQLVPVSGCDVYRVRDDDDDESSFVCAHCCVGKNNCSRQNIHRPICNILRSTSTSKYIIDVAGISFAENFMVSVQLPYTTTTHSSHASS